VAVAVALLCACTSSPDASTSTAAPITRTRTTTHTRPAPSSTSTFTPKPARSVAPLPPSKTPTHGGVERACPYIAATPADSPKRNVQDIEGDRVYRTTVLTRLRPVGCRFYFWAPPFEAIADIVPRRFATAVDAYNAMVRTGEAGRQAMGRHNIVPGVDGVLYRTKFFGPDGRSDWACVFASGRTMVIVHTQRNDVALNALLLARAIAGQF
jgi:hypothetical protein